MHIRARISEPPAGYDCAGSYAWEETLDFYGDVLFRAEFEDGRVRGLAQANLEFPYFGWAFRPLLVRGLKGRLRELVGAVREGSEPKPPTRHWWSPPGTTTPDQVQVVATLCFILAIVTYCGGLFTQTINAVAGSFGTDDAGLGVALAVTRVGTIIALVGAALADRRGRRRVIIWAVTGLCITTGLSAAAPTLGVFTAFQVLVRGCVNLASVVVFIAIVEEASEESRAYTLALALAAGGIGFGLGSLLLPIADLGTEAYRILFAVGLIGLAFVPGIARRLPETRRFAGLEARAASTGNPAEIVDERYGRRFLVLGLVALLTSFAAAPTSQFFNRYLIAERGFTGFDILVLRLVTQSAIPLVALLIGGRLAESRGRIRTARITLLAAAVADAAFFMATGIGLWIALLVTSTSTAAASPSMTSFGNELFPTEVRGTANGTLVVLAVLGSVAGLLTAGFLSDVVGEIGRAVAITDIGPVVVAIALIPFLPEASGRRLDDVSPPEV